MNSFNITRFGQTLRWVIAVNYRTMLLWTTGIALIFFVVELYILKMAHIPQDLMQSSLAFGIFVMMTAFAFLASYVTSFINEKRRRMAFLALPATNSEKYLSLITYTSVIWLCAVFLALIAGDSLRMLFCWIKYHSDTTPDEYYKWYSSVLTMFKYYFTIPSYARYETWFVAMKYILAVSFISWTHSLYTLGGTVLRKYSFVIATALFISCFVIFIEINSTYHFDWFEEEYIYIEEAGCHYAYSLEIGVVPYILNVLLPLLTVFNYWASYRTFKGFQVINHKWINL